MIRKGLYLSGGLAIAYAVGLALWNNINFGNIAMLLLGLCLLAAGIWYGKLKRFLHTRFGRAVGVLFGAGCLAALGILVFIGVQGHRVQVDFTEDAVIVLGAGVRGNTVTRTLQKRLDTAIRYAEKNPGAVIVVSGGQGPQETVTEGYAMKQYLIGHGVAAERILAEERSTSTQENFRFSKKLLDEVFGRPYRAAYVTNYFHAYRAGQYARREGVDAVPYPAGLDWHQVPINYLRELFAVCAMWTFAR